MTDSTAAGRLRLALDMYEVGEQMMRTRPRRELPDATEAEIDEQIRSWHRSKPSPEAAPYLIKRPS